MLNKKSCISQSILDFVNCDGEIEKKFIEVVGTSHDVKSVMRFVALNREETDIIAEKYFHGNMEKAKELVAAWDCYVIRVSDCISSLRFKISDYEGGVLGL